MENRRKMGRSKGFRSDLRCSAGLTSVLVIAVEQLFDRLGS